MTPNLKPNPTWKQILAVFLCALVGYLVVFYFIEHQRRKSGPWRMTFTTLDGWPAVRVSQPSLHLTNVTIAFVNAVAPTNLPQTVTFEHGRPAPFDLPFGQCVFIDALYLPGTAVCELFGHQIQLLPRVLTLDGIERPWRSGEKILLTNRPSATLPAH